MATPTNPFAIPSTIDTAALNTSLAEYSPTLTDNAYNKYVVTRLLNMNAKKMINGGLSIVEPLIETEQDEGGFYQGADVLSTTQTNTQTMVEYKWQNLYEPIAINRDEERMNSGEMHKILDLAATKVELSEKGIGLRLEKGLSKPLGGSGDLNDLETVCNTGVLGSLDGSAVTNWQATVTASGAFATQGLTDMTTAYYAVSGASDDENPTNIITTKAIFQKYEQTRLPLERISNGDLSANAGFRTLTFKGIPIVYGNEIGTGLMFGVNLNYLKLAVDTATDMVTTPFITPTNQTVKVAFILWRGNLITNNRRRNFKLTSIT
jgi:hypothetical protein